MENRNEGIIINADYMFHVFDDVDEPYLELEIQIFDGYECTMVFKSNEKIMMILNEIGNSDYKSIRSVKNLLHRKVLLYYNTSNISSAPISISSIAISVNPNYHVIEKDMC